MPILTSAERSGTVVGGRFRIDEELGRGGMGVVFAASDLLTGVEVVIKLPRLELTNDDTRTRRLAFEGVAMAQLSHPHIVRALAAGTTPDGLPFLALERLVGCTLEARLREQPNLSAEQALACLLPVMGALAYAHKQGWIHRDIKPANLFLHRGPDGSVIAKVLDFGTARHASGRSLTQSGQVVGTPDYMAPEYRMGAVSSSRSLDIWSFAAVLHRCLVGAPPLAVGQQRAAARHKLAVGSARALETQAGPWLGPAIRRGLRSDPRDRYANMALFARALAEAAWYQGLHLPGDPDPLGLPHFRRWRAEWQSRSQVTGPTPLRKRPSRSTRVLRFAAATLLAALGAAAFASSAAAPRRPDTPARPASKQLTRGTAGSVAVPDPVPVPDQEPAPLLERPAGPARAAPRHGQQRPGAQSRKRRTPRPSTSPRPPSLTQPSLTHHRSDVSSTAENPSPERRPSIKPSFGPLPKMKVTWQ